MIFIKTWIIGFLTACFIQQPQLAFELVHIQLLIQLLNLCAECEWRRSTRLWVIMKRGDFIKEKDKSTANEIISQSLVTRQICVCSWQGVSSIKPDMIFYLPRVIGQCLLLTIGCIQGTTRYRHNGIRRTLILFFTLALGMLATFNWNLCAPSVAGPSLTTLL